MDLEQVVKLNILGTVPERKKEFESLWGKYSPEISLSIDKPGYDIKAEYGLRISFNQRTFYQIWLLGFASWSAFVTYGSPILLSKLYSFPLDSVILDHDGQKKSEQHYKTLIAEVKSLSNLNFLEDYNWSKNIPHPNDIDNGNNQQKATFDITVMAAAFILLHEIRHIQISKDKIKYEEHEEELNCDTYAKNFILDEVEKYSITTNSNKLDVLSKRATSMAVFIHLLLSKVPLKNWRGTESHPPLSDRIRLFITEIEIPEYDHYWLYLSSVMLAQLRINNLMPESLSFDNYKDLCHKLNEHITS